MSYLTYGTPSSGPGSGTVTSVSGGNNITITGVATVNPTVNVSGTINHEVLLGNATGSINSLANGTTGQVLHAITGANDPVWSAVSLTADVSGILPIANGGTNANTMTNTDGVVYFDGTRLVTTTVGTATNVLTSNGVGVAPTFQTLPTSITTINGDTGSVTGATVSIKGNATAGSTVVFSGSGTAMTLGVTDASHNVILGSGAGNGAISGGNSVGLGYQVFQNLSSGANNVAIGYQSQSAQTITGSNNVSMGYQSLLNLSGGGNSVAIGALAMSAGVVTQANNVAIGFNSLQVTNGAQNTCLGAYSGAAYVGNESDNICIGYNTQGTAAESNVTRLGTSQTSCYVAGIDGVNVGNVAKVVTMASNQLGTATLTAGTGIASIVPTANTITINAAGTSASMISTTSQAWGLATGVTYRAISGQSTQNSLPGIYYIPVPVTTTFSDLYINVTTNAATVNVTVTLYSLALGATSLVVTITALTTGLYSDTNPAHAVTINAGDLVCYQISQSVTGQATGTSSMKMVA